MTKGFEGSVYHRSHEYALLDVILKCSTWFLVWSCRGSDMESTTDVLASLSVVKVPVVASAQSSETAVRAFIAVYACPCSIF
jgi:hypothetical protein